MRVFCPRAHRSSMSPALFGFGGTTGSQLSFDFEREIAVIKRPSTSAFGRFRQRAHPTSRLDRGRCARRRDGSAINASCKGATASGLLHGCRAANLRRWRGFPGATALPHKPESSTSIPAAICCRIRTSQELRSRVEEDDGNIRLHRSARWSTTRESLPPENAT